MTDASIEVMQPEVSRHEDPATPNADDSGQLEKSESDSDPERRRLSSSTSNVNTITGSASLPASLGRSPQQNSGLTLLLRQMGDLHSRLLVEANSLEAERSLFRTELLRLQPDMSMPKLPSQSISSRPGAMQSEESLVEGDMQCQTTVFPAPRASLPSEAMCLAAHQLPPQALQRQPQSPPHQQHHLSPTNAHTSPPASALRPSGFLVPGQLHDSQSSSDEATQPNPAPASSSGTEEGGGGGGSGRRVTLRSSAFAGGGPGFSHSHLPALTEVQRVTSGTVSHGSEASTSHPKSKASIYKMTFPGTTSFALQSDAVEHTSSSIGHRFADFFGGRNGGAQRAKFKRGMTFPHHSALEMKKRVERVLARPDEGHDRFLRNEGCAQAIAKSALFEFVTMCVIAANALWMAVDTDLNESDTVIESDLIFQITEHFFCLYFTFELSVRFFAFKEARLCCGDKWFIFDASMLLLMVTEVWIFTAIILVSRASDPNSKSVNGGAFGNASILKVARLIRLTRIARMAKLLRAMPEVMVILRAMFTATRTVIITLLILGMIVYVFAIGFCNITKDTQLGRMYFKDVRTGMLTLLVSGAFPDVWDIVHDVADTHWLLWVVLIIFLLLSTVTVMNMMIGVLVEVVNGASRTERETVEAELIRESFMKALRAKGYTEQPAEITLHKQHFLEILEVSIVRRTLASTGVDLAALVDLVDFLFRHKPTQRLLKLMETCLQLRSANTATVKDLIDIRRFITSELEWMAHRILVQMEESEKGRPPALSSTVDSVVFKQTCY